MSSMSKATECTVGDNVIRVIHSSYGENPDTEVMPNFFDEDFSLATATGFTSVWEGSYVLLDFVRNHEHDYDFKGTNCIELGSGCGMFGLCIASLGGNVLLSDVASVTNDITKINVRGNSKGAIDNFFVKTEAHKVGDGSAAALPIDWRKEIPSVIAEACKETTVILGSECVWLPELLPPFAEVNARLLKLCPAGARSLICYPVRGSDTSHFTTRRQFEEAFATEGLKLKLLSHKPFDPKNSDVKETCIFEATL